jgi:hypothetical protein
MKQKEKREEMEFALEKKKLQRERALLSLQ